MTDSRRKGQSFMLACCRALSHWWFATPLDEHYTKLPMRPKTTIVAPMEGWDRKGDLDVDPRYSDQWPFCVEAKKDEKWKGLEGLWEAPRYPLWQWWEQCVEQALTHESAHPLLIFSANRRKKYVLLLDETARWLQMRTAAQILHEPLLLLERPPREELVIGTLDALVTTSPRSPRKRRKTQ